MAQKPIPGSTNSPKPGSATQETPPPPAAATSKRWHQGWSNRLALAALILPLLWPIAPLIIWIYSSWSKKARVILTIIVLLLTLPLIELTPTLTRYAYQALLCRPSQVTPSTDLTQGIYGRFTVADDVQSPFRCTTRAAPESVIVLEKQAVETLLIARPGEKEDPIPLAQLFRFFSTEELERAAVRKTVASNGQYAFALDPGDYILCGKFYAGYSCIQVGINENQKASIDLNQAWGQLNFSCRDTQCQETPSLHTTVSISSWKTYRNASLGFELQHPSNFIDWEEFGPSEKLPRTISFHKGTENSFSLEGLYITVSDATKTLDDYIDQTIKRNESSAINETSLDGQRAIEIVYGDGKSMQLLFTEPDTYRGPRVYVSLKNGKFYYIEYHTDGQESMEIFDQILSTFRFLNS